jgi:hypothetical protein
LKFNYNLYFLISSSFFFVFDVFFKIMEKTGVKHQRDCDYKTVHNKRVCEDDSDKAEWSNLMNQRASITLLLKALKEEKRSIEEDKRILESRMRDVVSSVYKKDLASMFNCSACKCVVNFKKEGYAFLLSQPGYSWTTALCDACYQELDVKPAYHSNHRRPYLHVKVVDKQQSAESRIDLETAKSCLTKGYLLRLARQAANAGERDLIVRYTRPNGLCYESLVDSETGPGLWLYEPESPFLGTLRIVLK